MILLASGEVEKFSDTLLQDKLDNNNNNNNNNIMKPILRQCLVIVGLLVQFISMADRCLTGLTGEIFFFKQYIVKN